MKVSIEVLESQIKDLQKDYDYNLKEFPIDVILQRFKEDVETVDLSESVASIYIPPYQRKFVWKPDMKCKFIESLFLGVPIPPLFAFTLDESGNLELIDGVQRLSTLKEFVSGKLKIQGLDLLDQLNGFTFLDLHPSRQRKFNSIGIRMYVLSEKADEGVRADIFNRINSSGEKLKEAEIRKGAFLDNKFYSFILKCINLVEFEELFSSKKESDKQRGEKEELISRFYAYSDNYLSFEHSVKHFINNYIISAGRHGFDENQKKLELQNSMIFIKKHFPNGFRKSKSSESIPRVRFEAIAVGTNLALKQNKDLIPTYMDWLDSNEFKAHTTTDAANSKTKLRGRIEFVRDCLLNKIMKEDLSFPKS